MDNGDLISVLLTGFGISMIIAIIVGMIFLFIFWICMMFSSLRNKAISDTVSLVWFGLMLGLFLTGIGGGWIVAIVYYFTDRRKQFKCKCQTKKNGGD